MIAFDFHGVTFLRELGPRLQAPQEAPGAMPDPTPVEDRHRERARERFPDPPEHDTPGRRLDFAAGLAEGEEKGEHTDRLAGLRIESTWWLKQIGAETIEDAQLELDRLKSLSERNAFLEQQLNDMYDEERDRG